MIRVRNSGPEETGLPAAEPSADATSPGCRRPRTPKLAPMEPFIIGPIVWAISAYVLWAIIRSAVLSALRAHSQDENSRREKERLEHEVREAEREVRLADDN